MTRAEELAQILSTAGRRENLFAALDLLSDEEIAAITSRGHLHHDLMNALHSVKNDRHHAPDEFIHTIGMKAWKIADRRKSQAKPVEEIEPHTDHPLYGLF